MPETDLQVFQGYSQPWTSPDLFPLDKLSVTIESVGQDRSVEARRGDVIEGPVLVDSNGEVPVHRAEMLVAQDAISQLPRAGTELAKGKAYENAAPNPALVLANHAEGNLTLSQRIVSTPILIEVRDFGTVVRLKTTAFNRLTTVDPNAADLVASTPKLRSFDVGIAYFGVTDLLHVQGQGWRVLQFARLSPVEADETATTIEALREKEHHRFTACGTFRALSARTVALAREVGPPVPELAPCR